MHARSKRSARAWGRTKGFGGVARLSPGRGRIFLVCIVLVRIGDKRFLSKKSALDAVLGFIFASMMARAINGSAPFVATICGGFVLVLLRRGLAFLARRFHSIGRLVKGSSDLVIENGEINKDALAKNDYSEGDLMEDLRREGVAGAREVNFSLHRTQRRNERHQAD